MQVVHGKWWNSSSIICLYIGRLAKKLDEVEQSISLKFSGDDYN